MSKKDFEAIAAVLAKFRGVDASASIGSTAAAITLDLADVLAASNPRFDRERFFRAAQANLKVQP